MQTAAIIACAAVTLFSAASLFTRPDDIFFRETSHRRKRRVTAGNGG